MEIKGIKITQDDINRLYDKIIISNKNCWDADFAKNEKGYTCFSIKTISIYAHRFMYIIHHQDENIDNKLICHTCDNPWCINPEHLFSGTSQDNMNDKCNKERQAKGEISGSSVLTDSEIEDILQGILNYSYKSITEISNVYLVGVTTICNVLHGNTWTHITKNYDLNKINNIINNNNLYKKKLTNTNVKDIRKRLENKETCISISKIYNVHEYTISQIKNNKRHKNK